MLFVFILLYGRCSVFYVNGIFGLPWGQSVKSIYAEHNARTSYKEHISRYLRALLQGSATPGTCRWPSSLPNSTTGGQADNPWRTQLILSTRHAREKPSAYPARDQQSTDTVTSPLSVHPVSVLREDTRMRMSQCSQAQLF